MTTVRVAIEAVACGDPAAPDGGGAVGQVVEAGEGAAHLLGRRVLVPAVDGCGECDRCRRALPFACAEGARPCAAAWGGEATVRARWALPLDGGLDIPGPIAALAAGEAADAYALAARVGLAAGDRVRIHGAGPIAALARQVARLRGAREPEHGAPADKHIVGDDVDLPRAIAEAGPGALVVVRARGDVDASGAGGLLARGGALIGVPHAHPDLLPEVAALVVKGELDLAAAAEVVQGPLPHAELVSLWRRSVSAGKALVVCLR